MVRVYVVWTEFRTQSRGVERNARDSWDESRFRCAGRTAEEIEAWMGVQWLLLVFDSLQ